MANGNKASRTETLGTGNSAGESSNTTCLMEIMRIHDQQD